MPVHWCSWSAVLVAPSHHWCLMLAYGCRCIVECQRFLHERWCRYWSSGFFPRLPGCLDDDGDVEPHAVRLLEVQTEPKGFVPPSPHTNSVDTACNCFRQHPTHVDFDPRIMEVVLCTQRRSRPFHKLDHNRLQLPSVGRRHAPRVQQAPGLVRQRRKCILGCDLLLWQ